MNTALLTLLHLAVAAAKLCRPGGVRAVIAENLLPKQRYCQVNSPHDTMPGCTLDDPATFGIAFRLTSSATPCGCTTDTV
jgi:hypothetical protein